MHTQRQLKYQLLRTDWPKIRDLGPKRRKRYMVDGRINGWGEREAFHKLTDARTRADQLATELANKGTEAMSLETVDRILLVECRAKLRPFAKTLRDATDHYVTHLKSEEAKRQSQLLANCVDEYLEARQRDLERGELGKRSLAEIVGRAKQLKSVLGSLHVGEIGHDRIKTFIESHPVAARTRTNVRLRASKFFNWCRDKGYIDHNPCERIRFKVPESDIHIMTVDAVRTLLSAAKASGHADILAYVVLGLFAGIRVAEIHALRWEHVDLETRTVEVAAESSKVRKQRFVEINDTLLAWLKPIYRKRGKITGPNFRRRWAATLKAAGYSKQNRLPQNILRHTAASMMIAVSHRGVVSEQLGNSPQVLAAHYRRPVPKRVAAVYWSLRP